jgi:hypothetical protein
MMEDQIPNAHIPSYLKHQLLSASKRHGDMKSYLDVGYHMGRHHLDDFCEDLDRARNATEDEVMNHPTRVLRDIFSSEDHPRGELIELIPSPRRRAFLLGILAGLSEESPGDFWLSRAGVGERG